MRGGGPTEFFRLISGNRPGAFVGQILAAPRSDTFGKTNNTSARTGRLSNQVDRKSQIRLDTGSGETARSRWRPSIYDLPVARQAPNADYTRRLCRDRSSATSAAAWLARRRGALGTDAETRRRCLFHQPVYSEREPNPPGDYLCATRSARRACCRADAARGALGRQLLCDTSYPAGHGASAGPSRHGNSLHRPLRSTSKVRRICISAPVPVEPTKFPSCRPEKVNHPLELSPVIITDYGAASFQPPCNCDLSRATSCFRSARLARLTFSSGSTRWSYNSYARKSVPGTSHSVNR